MSTQKFATGALHAGHDVSVNGGTRAVPIYQTTSYVFNNADHAANLFNLSESGYIYTRLNNPTNDVLEQRLAALEGGIAGVVTASGTAAINTTLLTLLKAGDHIVASNSLYGGTYNLLNVTLPRFGITTTFVDPSDAQNFKDAVQENTRVFFVESLGNPKLDVLDLKSISKEAKFPEFTEPSPGYHGLVYHEALGPAAFIAKVRIEGLRDHGAALSPFNAFQILQGLETLEIRIKKHSQNALELAQWLEAQDQVNWVKYPGLKNDPYNKLATQYLPKGQSGIVTFGVQGGFESAKTIANETKIFSLLANIGDSKSLIIHPASTTHQQLDEDQQKSTGVTQDLIRLSVGLEDIEDLKEDLKAAFVKVKETVR